MTKIKKINVQSIEISVISSNGNDFICITDIAKSKEGESRAADIIKNWIRSRTTLEFLGTWEQLNNPDFKVVEFDHFKMQAGLPNFVLGPGTWVEKTNAKGIYVKLGKYGGTYAHKDIAFEFCSAISPVFKLFLIKEFQCLKEDENSRLKLEWNLQRTLAKINYRIHTDAIKENLIPKQLAREQVNQIYANEADLLNMALFGKTAKQWRDENPETDGNIRDVATIEQPVVLSNLESINSVLIHQGLKQSERLIQLNKIAITHVKLAKILPKIGEGVFAIGNLEGLEQTLSNGIISSYREDKTYIQTNTAITHGSSGGPLFNMKGEVIGIISLGKQEGSLFFALSILKIPYSSCIK